MISIIIPTFKEEKVIADSIQRIKKGLSLPYEIIISDGGSTDRTVEIAKLYANKVIVGGLGISKQRNAGARVASGEFLVFLDAQSIVPEPASFFKEALSQFDNKNLVGLGSKLNIDSAVETFTDKVMCGIMNFLYIFWTNVLGIGSAQGKFQMVRPDAFFKISGYREDFATCEDIDLFRRLSKIGKTRIDPRLTVYHPGRREHEWGWPKLLFTWTINTLWVMIAGTPKAKAWKPVR